jgi:hypothetical protein
MANGEYQVRLRVERAKELRADLEREMRAWAKSGAYRVISKYDSQTGYTFFYLDNVAEVAPKISALISELLHTLRTALDNLAYQLFLACRTDPEDEGASIYFPIYDEGKISESNAFKSIKAFRSEILEVFHTLNPCKSGNALLWALHRLDIVDKHRRILTSTLMHHSIFLGDAQRQLLIDKDYADMIPFISLRQSFMPSAKSGHAAQVGDVVFVGMPGDEQVNQKLQFTFDIAFNEPGIIESKSMIETVDEMVTLVESIISTFAPFLV